MTRMSQATPKMPKNAHAGAYTTWHRRLGARHWYAICTAFARICRTPVATFMTILVIGLALTLPAGLLLLLGQAQQLIDKSYQHSQISVFIAEGTQAAEVEDIVSQLSYDRRIKQARYITPEKVMQEFQAAAGIGAWTQQLGESPLPGIIEITPAYYLTDNKSIDELINELKQLPNVELAQLDIEWMHRLQAIIDVVRQAAMLLLVLVGIGVVMIVANTIRLVQELYRSELEIMRLVGASHSFVTRPFVYSGLFYGVLGGIISWLVLDFFIVWLAPAMQIIFNLYNTNMVMSELSVTTLLSLVLVGAIFGVIGSLCSVFVFSLKQEREILI